MNWLGNSFAVAMNRLPFVLAILFFALYAGMLWLVLFRRPAFRNLPGRDRWSVLMSTFGVMLVWMGLSCLGGWTSGHLFRDAYMVKSTPVQVRWFRAMLLPFLSMLFTWPIAAWVAFRIALRRLGKSERRLAISRLFLRVSAAFVLSFSLVWGFFHFAVAGCHSFDHVTEFGPRNMGAMLEWGVEEFLDFGDGYRARFPVRDNCPLCRLEPIIGRAEAEESRAKEVEREAREEARRKRNQDIENALLEESLSHAEAVEVAEDDPHAESEEAGVAPEGE